MVDDIHFFESIEHLEPRCPKCKNKIDYGVTTKFNNRYKAHVCLNCNHILK